MITFNSDAGKEISNGSMPTCALDYLMKHKFDNELTFTAVAGITDRLSHHDGMLYATITVDTEMTDYIVQHLLLCQSIRTV